MSEHAIPSRSAYVMAFVDDHEIIGEGFLFKPSVERLDRCHRQRLVFAMIPARDQTMMGVNLRQRSRGLREKFLTVHENEDPLVSLNRTLCHVGKTKRLAGAGRQHAADRAIARKVRCAKVSDKPVLVSAKN